MFYYDGIIYFVCVVMELFLIMLEIKKKNFCINEYSSIDLFCNDCNFKWWLLIDVIN